MFETCSLMLFFPVHVREAVVQLASSILEIALIDVQEAKSRLALLQIQTFGSRDAKVVDAVVELIGYRLDSRVSPGQVEEI